MRADFSFVALSAFVVLGAASFAACGDGGTSTETGGAGGQGGEGTSSSSSGAQSVGSGGSGGAVGVGGAGGSGAAGGAAGTGGVGGAGVGGAGGAGVGGAGVGGAGVGGMGVGGVGVGGAGVGGAGVGGAGVGGAGVGGGGGAGGGSAQDCQTCATNSCLGELAGCQGGAACGMWLACVQMCQDAACVTMCDQQYPNAKPLYDPVYACTCASCENECAIFDPCTKVGGSVDACNNCAANSCLNDLVACQNDATCGMWLACAQPCQDAACMTMCDQQYPNAKPLYDPIYACTCSSCTQECSVMDPCSKVPTAQDCTPCVTNSCFFQAASCQQSADCAPWLTCIQGCQDAACADMCDQQYPNAKPLYDPVYTCACNSCMNECAALDPCN